MIDFSQKPPTWINNRQPVRNTVYWFIKKGLIKIMEPEEEKSGYDFLNELTAWGERLEPGTVFSRIDWINYAMEQSGGSGMDFQQATSAWKARGKYIKAKVHRKREPGQVRYKLWIKC